MSEQEVKRSEKLLLSLGLCVRAGKVIFGVPMICEAMRKGGAQRPRAVFEANDTSENTHKRIADKCKFYNIRLYRLSVDGVTLAESLGKSASLAAVALTDENFCRLAEKQIF